MQPAQPMTPLPGQAAQTGPFGPLVAVFEGATIANTIYGLLSLIVAAGSLALFIPNPNNNLVFAFIGLIFLIVAAYLLVMSALNSRNKVLAYQEGLVVVRGSRIDAIPWDAITTFYQRVVRYRYSLIITYTARRYIVERADGKRFTFSQYKNIARLGEIISQQTATRKLPQAQAAYQAGQTLTFGKMSLSQAGLSNGRETIPWSEVSGVRVVNGAIVISRQSKRLAWASAAVATTPNPQVFITLVQNLAGRR